MMMLVVVVRVTVMVMVAGVKLRMPLLTIDHHVRSW